jgi:hypothetical protein
MDVFEAMATTRAVRRLDPERSPSDAAALTHRRGRHQGRQRRQLPTRPWLVVRDASSAAPR